MKRFTQWQIDDALAHAAAGHQALHTHRIIMDYDRAPRVFVQAVDRGEDIAHLFDRDELRLVATARQLGVRVIFVDRAGTNRQHIDLCGAPLWRALFLCELGEE